MVAGVRIVVVSTANVAEATVTLRDLGCAVRTASPLELPSRYTRGIDALVVEAGDDAEVGRFVLQRVRALGEHIPTLLAVQTSQLTRVDPRWAYDDLVLQPYVPQELYVRLRTLEWRASEFSGPERIKLGALVIDLSAHEAAVGGRALSLTPREFALLTLLARHRGRVLTRATLLREVWGARSTESRSLDVHIRRLRSALGAEVSLVTVRGVGYRLGEAPDGVVREAPVSVSVSPEGDSR